MLNVLLREEYFKETKQLWVLFSLFSFDLIYMEDKYCVFCFTSV